MNRNVRTRQIYEKFHNVRLPKDLEVHHIIPVHAGGTDDPQNLVALTKEQHKESHLKRYEETKDFRDLCAYHMIGYNFTEAHKISSSEGGKKGGNRVKDLGVGICCSDAKKRSQWASLGGKAGGKIQYEKKMGIHAQTREERLAFSSLGGKIGAFTKPEIQSMLGKRGGKKNKGFVWLTDGNTTIKYSKKQQKTKSVKQFLKENPTFRQGRGSANRDENGRQDKERRNNNGKDQINNQTRS